MEVTSSLNNHTFNTTIFRIVGPFLFFQKQTVLLFLSHLHRLIDGRLFSQKIKRPPCNIYYETNGLINRLLDVLRRA